MSPALKEALDALTAQTVSTFDRTFSELTYGDVTAATLAAEDVAEKIPDASETERDELATSRGISGGCLGPVSVRVE
jgi:phage FluMu protein gp41